MSKKVHGRADNRHASDGREQIGHGERVRRGGAASDRMTIRPHPLISVLGGLLGVVVTAPGVIGAIAAALQPAAVAQEPWGVLFCLIQTVLGGWLAYRWLTIRGVADAHEFYLRGWFRTLAVPTCHVAAVRCVEREFIGDSGSQQRTHEVLIDHGGESLGVIPGVLGMCAGWTQFLAHLRRLAAASRARGPAAAEPRALEDIPVKEWTIDDFTRYEQATEAPVSPDLPHSTPGG